MSPPCTTRSSSASAWPGCSDGCSGGTDTGAFYRELSRLGELPHGSTMLERARDEAERRGIHWIEFAQADVEALPFDARSFDLCVTYTGLHCFPDPAAALAELARVLRPGGELRGTAVIRGAGVRQDAAVRVMQLAGLFGPTGRLAELSSWLTAAGLHDVHVHRGGALAFFSARRPSPTC